MTDVSVGVRTKRKRGRPRKDSNLCREGTLQSPENAAAFMKTHQGPELLHPTSAADHGTKKSQDVDKNSKDCSDEGMVGSMVYGVVEGSFDAGYLISVRIGNNLAPFRGVVFQPRKVVAVTAANDVAPQAKMYQRREIPVPVYDNLSQLEMATLQPVQAPKQAVARPSTSTMLRTTGSSSNVEGNKMAYAHPRGNLRMVEEDEVMQAFEVSTSSGGGGSKNSLATNGKESINEEAQPQVHGGKGVAPPSAFDEIQEDELIDELRPPTLYYNGNLFSDANSRPTPNLKLDLAFTAHKENNIGYHQALVAGNPLLLPPDLFIMEKPKTPPNCTNANMEAQSRFGGGGDDAQAQLDLATPHSPLNTRIADMDFVLTTAIQQPTTQPHANQ